MTAIIRTELSVRRQQGMATLMFAVVLLISLTIITFMTAKTLLTEQAISANEYRSKEASYAAEAALEYAIAWLDTNDPAYASWNAADLNTNGTNFDDLAPAATSITSGSDTYTLTALFERACLDDPEPADLADCQQWVIEVSAQAVAASDSDLSRVQRIRLLQTPNTNDTTKTDFIRVPGSWRDW